MIETENNNKIEITEQIENESDDEEEEEEEDGNDEEGWITPGNIKKVKQDMGYDDEINMQDTNIKCACLTTDFAMQVMNIILK